MMYGIYNTYRKEFQFGIAEASKEEALRKLYNKIGKDAYKWRFEARVLTEAEALKMKEAYTQYKEELRKEREQWRAERKHRRELKELDTMVLKKNTPQKPKAVKPMPESFVVIDFETTGLDATNDRIIEIGVVRFTKGDPVALFNCMVKQDLEAHPFNKQMQDMTGHTPEDIAKGMDEDKAMSLLFDFIADAELLVGHNLLFDFEFLTQGMQRNWDYIAGSDAVAVSFEDNVYDMIDTLTIGRDRKKYPHRLANMCQYYGIEQQNWHSAYYDCLATGDLLLAMHAEDKDYPEGKQVADYINLIGYKRQYGEPTWVPSWVTLKPQGNMSVKEGGK